MDKDPFDQGWSAYEEGYFESENPYEYGTGPNRDWENGWLCAKDYYDNLGEEFNEGDE